MILLYKSDNNKISFLLILTLLFVMGCKSIEYRKIDNESYVVPTPPGTIKILDNFYSDISEVSNIDYKEYMYWIARIFGESSKEYIFAMPDTTVWSYFDYTKELQETYYQKPLFNYYPVVGISFVQAKVYAKWRTDRVAEMLLIRKELIKYDDVPTRDNYFTINRYLEGGHDWIIFQKNILIPTYKLPTEEEWKFISGVNSNFTSGIDSTTRYNREILKESKCLNNTKEYHASSNNLDVNLETQKIFAIETTTDVRSFSKNIYGLFGIGGNVSELSGDSLISHGNNWANKIDSIHADDQFEIPNCWTGFRFVATLELIGNK